MGSGNPEATILGTCAVGARSRSLRANRLTDFSPPLSGAYYFAPSLDALNELAGPDVDPW
jgi:hypothetical protein